jgi:hypothetical protein
VWGAFEEESTVPNNGINEKNHSHQPSDETVQEKEDTFLRVGLRYSLDGLSCENT